MKLDRTVNKIFDELGSYSEENKIEQRTWVIFASFQSPLYGALTKTKVNKNLLTSLLLIVNLNLSHKQKRRK